MWLTIWTALYLTIAAGWALTETWWTLPPSLTTAIAINAIYRLGSTSGSG